MYSSLVILLLFQVVASLIVTSPPSVQGSYESAPHTFSTTVPAYPGISGELVLADPPLACTHLNNAAAIAGKIALIFAGGCYAEQKTAYAYEAGAVAVVMASQAPFVVLQFSLDGSVSDIPSICITPMAASMLEAELATSTVNVVLYQNPMNPTHKSHLLDFRSRLEKTPWAYAPFGGIAVDWSSPNACSEWFGVSCDMDGNVTGLSLSSVGMVGTIPDSLYQLTTLKHLDIGSNSLTGTLSPAIGAISELVTFFIDINKLTGQLPSTIGNLKQLTFVFLGSNLLSGEIAHDTFLGCDSLVVLWFADNQFSGLLPPLPPSLASLKASENKFSGPIPDLSHLYLSDIDLGNNEFSGSLSSFGNPDYLNQIVLSGNNLVGTIPESINELIALTSLDLSNNAFSGPLPSLSNLTALVKLDISNNSISGVMGEKGFPPNVRFLQATHNEFTDIHPSITNVIDLITIDVSYNKLQSFSSVTSLPVLTEDDIAATGKIGLLTIDLSHNQITSSNVQPDFMFHPSLITYNLAYNNLSGTPLILYYPQHAITVLDLSNNNFSGEFADYMLYWPSLGSVHLEGNNFSSSKDELPNSFILDYSVLALSSYGNLRCPQVTSAKGAIVTIDHKYHKYQLCKCLPNFRRVNSSDFLECEKCPTHMTCPGDLKDMEYVLEPNFYPTPNEENPTFLLACPNCDNENHIFRCRAGFQGRLCSDCIKGFYHRSSKCLACGPLSNFFLSMIIIMFFLALLGFGFWFSSYGAKYCINQDKKQKVSSPATAATATITTTATDSPEMGMSKALSTPQKEHSRRSWARIIAFLASRTVNNLIITYYQAINILSTGSPFNINTVLQVAELANLSVVGVGFECLSPKLKSFMARYLTVVLQPLFVTVVIGIVFIVGYPTLKATRRQWWKYVCGRTLLFLLNFLYFPVVTTSISAFRCEDDPATGISYMLNYPYAECSSVPASIKVLFILLNTVGIFALFTYLVVRYQNTNALDARAVDIKKYFGFFVGGFKSGMVYTSLGLLIRRLMLSIITGLLPPGTLRRYAANTFILLVSIGLTTVLQPYKKQVDNLTENISMLALLVSYSFGQVAISAGDTLDGDSYQVGRALYLLINVLIGLWFIILFSAARLRPIANALLKRSTLRFLSAIRLTRYPSGAGRRRSARVLPMSTRSLNTSSTVPSSDSSFFE